MGFHLAIGREEDAGRTIVAQVAAALAAESDSRLSRGTEPSYCAAFDMGMAPSNANAVLASSQRVGDGAPLLR